MSYVATTTTLYSPAGHATYRGKVIEYTNTPTVYVYQCANTYGSKIQAEREAKKLVTKLKKICK